MKILHHGYAYPNFCKCRNCDCEFIYEDNETVSILDYPYGNKPKTLVWTHIVCPECKSINSISHYNGKIENVRKYDCSGKYQEIVFDENTMERR